jgi:hypothetical protein
VSRPKPPWAVWQVGDGRETVFGHRHTRADADRYAARLNRTMTAEGALRYEVRPTEQAADVDPDPVFDAPV